jgi:hypothetical protein
MLLSALAVCISARAQQNVQSNAQRLQSYDVSREVSLVGTVIKFEAASTTAPLGAHVLVQTASGQVDVHLGNVQVLKANHVQLNAGDNVRIIGESLAVGESTTFAARILQKGTQAVVLRSTRGFLLTPASSMTQEQKDALRGVR